MSNRALLLAALALGLVACQKERPIEGLRTYQHAGGEVRSGSLAYAESPPAGGAHNALWQTCDIYAEPVYNEYAVASLERGAVWVTYRPGLGAEALTALKTALDGVPELLVSPYPGLSAPIVVTVWNAQLPLDEPSDPRLERFLKDYAESPTAPLPDASCAGGYGGTRLGG